MKAISLWQPWASLIAWGEKQYETRHWYASYRGLLAIHAAKRKPTYDDTVHMKDEFYAACRRNQYTQDYGLSTLPLGAVLCIVDLKAVIQTSPNLIRQIGQKEAAFGDYSPGRYAWKMEVVEVFDKPIPARGEQGLWNWERP